MECTTCNTFVNTYVPQPHQEAFHRDSHTIAGNFGGYGTGKTTTSREEIYKHVLLTPNANVLIGADVSSTYEQTLKREIEHDIPAAFVRDYSVQKAYMELRNGARILYRPLADPDRLRSYNLTMFVIVEASETKIEAFSQLKTRLRNTAATKPKKDKEGNLIYREGDNGVMIPTIETDWLKGIVESNPDSGWIRSEVLMAADVIQRHGTVLDDYKQNEDRKDPLTSAHVASTDVNKYLPDNFIKMITANKPGWWINRYVLGSFLYAEGLVYPGALQCVVSTFPIPSNWKRILAFDYGLADDAVYLCGAVDPYEGYLYIYRETRTNNRRVDELAQLYRDTTSDIPIGGYICSPIADPKSISKRDYNKKSLGDLFLEEGIAFEPGYVNIDARVYRLNTYIESGKVKIMDCCTGLINELRDYKFKTKTLDSTVKGDKPIDRNNHGINPLEWIVMRLPSDPKNLIAGAYGQHGEELISMIQPQDGILPYALQATEQYEDGYNIFL